MIEGKNGQRVLLDVKAAEQLDSMLSVLSQESEFIKINPSKLASWIIGYFQVNHFAGLKKDISKSHFNPKAYLLNVAQRANTEEEAKALLSDALEHLQAGSKSRKRKAPNDREGNE